MENVIEGNCQRLRWTENVIRMLAVVTQHSSDLQVPHTHASITRYFCIQSTDIDRLDGSRILFKFYSEKKKSNQFFCKKKNEF